MPKLGKRIELADCRGKVIRQNVMDQTITIMTEEGREVEKRVDELQMAQPASPPPSPAAASPPPSKPRGKGDRERGKRGRRENEPRRESNENPSRENDDREE